MNANDPQAVIIGAVLLLSVIGAIVVIARERRKAQSKRLQQRFGPEYNRVVKTIGDQEKAEAARFAQEWQTLQGRFVDNPTGVVSDADSLVRELMLKRGYPMGDFERRAADPCRLSLVGMNLAVLAELVCLTGGQRLRQAE